MTVWLFLSCYGSAFCARWCWRRLHLTCMKSTLFLIVRLRRWLSCRHWIELKYTLGCQCWPGWLALDTTLHSRMIMMMTLMTIACRVQIGHTMEWLATRSSPPLLLLLAYTKITFIIILLLNVRLSGPTPLSVPSTDRSKSLSGRRQDSRSEGARGWQAAPLMDGEGR